MAYTRFGEFMRVLRIKNHEVMGDTATLLGVTIPFVSAVENGKKNVPVKAPTKYAFAYEDGKHFVAGSKDGKNPDYTDRGAYRTFYPKRRKK